MPQPQIPPHDPHHASNATDQAGSDTGWSTATGTMTIRRPDALDTDSKPGDTSFNEQRGTDGPSLEIL